MGHDAAIGFAGALGNFELNVMKPLIGHDFLASARLLTDATQSFTERCVVGLTANRARIDELLRRSLMLVTALAPHIGYDRAAEVARHAHVNGLTLREAAIAVGHITGEQFDAWVQPEAMVGEATPG
jgi:fumarate hydratase class II